MNCINKVNSIVRFFESECDLNRGGVRRMRAWLPARHRGWAWLADSCSLSSRCALSLCRSEVGDARITDTYEPIAQASVSRFCSGGGDAVLTSRTGSDRDIEEICSRNALLNRVEVGIEPDHARGRV